MLERISASLVALPFVEIVGSSNNEEEAYADISRLRPDFLILDINLKEEDKISLLKKLKAELPGIKVTILDHSSPEFFIR